MERVRIYDPDSGEISTIPAAELAPSMVEVRLQQENGQPEQLVWVESAKLKQGQYRHPPFPEEVRQYFRMLVDMLHEVDPRDVADWEDGFRRDQNWQQELGIFLHVATIYQRLTRDNHMEFARKQDIYRVIIGCIISPREQILNVVNLTVLSREEALGVIDEFHKPS